MRKSLLAFAVTLLLAGCSVGIGVSLPIGGNVNLSMDKKVWDAGDIKGEVVWSGETVVKKQVVVKKGGTLKILPGAKIVFDLEDTDHVNPNHDHSDYENSWILVEGKVIAEGEPERKIVFSPKKDHSASDRIDAFAIIGAEGAQFSQVVFEKCGWAVHLHDTPGAKFTNSIFRGNYGGVRFKGDDVTFASNLFEKNIIGVRAIEAGGAVFADNDFRSNLTGIFFREGVTGPRITGNRFANDEYDIKLGEGQTEDVTAAGNSWKASGRLAETIYDGADSEGIGRVHTEETDGGNTK